MYIEDYLKRIIDKLSIHDKESYHTICKEDIPSLIFVYEHIIHEGKLFSTLTQHELVICVNNSERTYICKDAICINWEKTKYNYKI